jgi:ABC-type sugar transport system substrate-binding protein
MNVARKRWHALVVGLVAALALAGCGSSGSDSAGGGDKPDIGFMAFDIGLDPFVSAMVDEIKSEAKAKGVDLDVRNGANDLNKQISQVQDFITARKDAIIVYPGDPEGLGPAIRQAQKAGIPVFTVNLQLNKNIPVTAYVGADDEDYGRQQGEMLVEALGGKGEVALAMGGLGTSAQILRTKGFEEVVAKNPGIKIVEKQSDGWQGDKTLALTQDWVSKYPADKLDAIVVQGPQAMGAVRWAHKNGRSNLKWVLGDYPTDLVDPIKKGLIVGTISQDPAEQGREVLNAALAYLGGDKDDVKKEQFTPLPRVTKDNVDELKPVFGL